MPGFLAQIRRQAVMPWIALLCAVSLSLILMSSGGSRGSELVKERTAAILAVLAQPFGIVPAIVHLSRENARLRAENASLMIKFTDAEEAFRENKRLRELLDFRERSNLKLEAAEVIATNPMPGVHSILIDIGANKNAAKHMAVINDKGLIGKLVQVSEKTSIVQLLLDRNLGAAVRLANCRADGITAWAGGERLLLENIPVSENVQLGEKVITSGLDGVFPAGIPVGEVVRTDRNPESLFLRVEVAPVVDFSVLEEVFIVFVNSSSAEPS